MSRKKEDYSLSKWDKVAYVCLAILGVALTVRTFYVVISL